METRSRGKVARASSKGEKAPAIVLVDDDQKVIELLQIALSSRGYRTFTASDGEEAIQLVEKVNPDVIVLDVRLPKKNGYQVCEAIKSNPKTHSIPIVMISGLVEPSARVQGLRCGAEDYLTKPFSPKELLLRIQKILLRASEARSRALMSAELERELLERQKRLNLTQRRLAKRVERVVALADMGRKMAGARGFEELSEELLLSLEICLRAPAAMIALRTRTDEEFRPFKHYGISSRCVDNIVIPAGGRLCERLVAEDRALTIEELDSVAGLRKDLLPMSAAGLSLAVVANGLDGPAALVLVGTDLEAGAFTQEQKQDLESLNMFFTTGLISLQRAEQERTGLIDTVETLIDVLEADVPDRRGHSHRVARYVESIAEALGMCSYKLQGMRLAALLHEVQDPRPGSPGFGRAYCSDRGAWRSADGSHDKRQDLPTSAPGLKCLDARESVCECRGEESDYPGEGCERHGNVCENHGHDSDCHRSGESPHAQDRGCPVGDRDSHGHDNCRRAGDLDGREREQHSTGHNRQGRKPSRLGQDDNPHKQEHERSEGDRDRLGPEHEQHGGEDLHAGVICLRRGHGLPAPRAERSAFPSEVFASLQHFRERYDGRGIPSGLRAEDIPIEARILAVADTFDDCLQRGDSLAPVDRAIRALRNLSGTSLDPNIVEALIHHILSGQVRLG